MGKRDEGYPQGQLAAQQASVAAQTGQVFPERPKQASVAAQTGQVFPERPKQAARALPSQRLASEADAVIFLFDHRLRFGNETVTGLSADMVEMAFSEDGMSLLVRHKATGEEVEIPRSACVLHFPPVKKDPDA